MFIREIWKMLPKSFHRGFYKYLALTAVYEGYHVGHSYILSLFLILLEQKAELNVWVILFCVLILLSELITRVDNLRDHVIVNLQYMLTEFLKVASFEKILDMDMPFFKTIKSGALAAMIDRGNSKGPNFLGAILWELLSTSMQLIASLVMVLFFSWHSAPIAIFTLSIFVWMTIESIKARAEYRRQRYDLDEEISDMLVETAQSIVTVKTYAQESNVLKKFQSLVAEWVRTGMEEVDLLIYKYHRMRQRLLGLSQIFLWAVWVYSFYQGDLSTAGFVYLFTLFAKIYGSIWRMDRILETGVEAGEANGRQLAFLKTERTLPLGNGLENLATPVTVEFQDVYFSHQDGNGNGAIHGMSFSIEGGSNVAIVGESGSGKSTIVDLIRRFYDVTDGRILVNGLDVRDWDLHALRKMISVVDQEVAVFNNTAFANIAFPNPDASLEEVQEAATVAGIASKIESLPNGYFTPLGERGVTLSGGERQRLELARAFLDSGSLLIFDEATSALDPVIEKEILSSIREILKNRTGITIAHRLSTIFHSDKIIVLDKGKVVEQGTHDELMNLNGAYYSLVLPQTQA